MSRHRATPTMRTLYAEAVARALYRTDPWARYRPTRGKHRQWTALERRTWPLMAMGVRP